MIAENYQYAEETNLIRDLVRTNAVGDTYYFIYNRVIDFPQDMEKDTFAATEWRQHPEFPGGAIFDTGVHDMAAIRHIFGAVESVHAFGVPQQRDFALIQLFRPISNSKMGLSANFHFLQLEKKCSVH